MRMIMLIDMDYFYAACEELRHPEIVGKPVVVGMDPKGGAGRGVVMTCNYEARKFGIHSGMPISMAYKAKPDAIYLIVDFDYYEAISKKVMDVVKSFAAKFEQVSVDEAYIDVTSKVDGYDDSMQYAKKIHDEVLDRIGLKCSIGIGSSKLVAKMACEKAKPNGIKLVKDEEFAPLFGEMDVDKLYGIGGKTAQRLKEMGYATINQLGKANRMKMIDQFGVWGAAMIMNAKGVDDSQVVENYEVKSIGRELTFETNTNDIGDIDNAITKLSKEVIVEVERAEKSFRTITLKLRYGDFTEHIHSKSIRPTASIDVLIQTSRSLYSQSVDKTKKVRKIGVRVSNLSSRKGQRKII